MSIESEDGLKKKILLKLKNLNIFIRNIEDYSVQYNLDIKSDQLYIVACSQRALLKELLDLK